MNSWDDLKGNVSGWFDTAAHRTDRLARLGVRAYDRYGIHRDLDRHFANLGALVNRILSEDPEAILGENAAVRAEMGRIARLQDELSNTQTEMNDLREDLKPEAEADSDSSEWASSTGEPGSGAPDSAPEAQEPAETADSEPPTADEDEPKSG